MTASGTRSLFSVLPRALSLIVVTDLAVSTLFCLPTAFADSPLPLTCVSQTVSIRSGALARTESGCESVVANLGQVIVPGLVSWSASVSASTNVAGISSAHSVSTSAVALTDGTISTDARGTLTIPEGSTTQRRIRVSTSVVPGAGSQIFPPFDSLAIGSKFAALDSGDSTQFFDLSPGTHQVRLSMSTDFFRVTSLRRSVGASFFLLDQCSDGLDNDGDGCTDLWDISCASSDGGDESLPREAAFSLATGEGFASPTSAFDVSTTQFLGVVLSISAPATIDRIGGLFLPSATAPGTIFAAIVTLDDTTDLPDSLDLSTPDVLAHTLFEPAGESQDSVGMLAEPLVLEPGVYALVFGGGLFGSTGSAGAATGHTRVGAPIYFFSQGLVGWFPTGDLGVRFLIRGSRGLDLDLNGVPDCFNLESERIVRSQQNGQLEDAPTYAWRGCASCSAASAPGTIIEYPRESAGKCQLEIKGDSLSRSNSFDVFFTAFNPNVSGACPWEVSCGRLCSSKSCFREGIDQPICPALQPDPETGQRESFDPRIHDECCIRDFGVDFFCFRNGVQQLESPGQADDDGVAGACDNCPSLPNGPRRGTCRAGFRGLACQRDLDCGVGGRCSLEQEDLNGNGVGDACEPCGDVNQDGAVDAADASTILKSRLRPPPANLRFDAALCDVNADGRCDASDATTILKSKLRPPTATVQQTCAGAPPP